MKSRLSVKVWCVVGILFLLVGVAFAGEVKISHYWPSGGFGKVAMDKLIEAFSQKYPDIKVVEVTVEHEAYKTKIMSLVTTAEAPDLFSYWAGARTQFLADAGVLYPVDELWKANNLDAEYPPSIVNSAVIYNGRYYMVPLGMHLAGFIYNKKVFEKYGLSEPQTWEEFLKLCETLKSNGVYPLVTGAKFRWPLQFFFDYLNLRTGGPEFREGVQSGKIPYTDPRVVKTMEIWKELIEKEYFMPGFSAWDWDEALRYLVGGQAAMYLMGDWALATLNQDLGAVPGVDYDWFEFPVVDPSAPKTMVGPIDGFVISDKGPNKAEAEKLFLFMASPEGQTIFNRYKGSNPCNVKASVERDVVQQEEFEALQKCTGFHFNYDLSTPPAVAELGLDAFVEFMHNPADYKGILERVQTKAAEAFKSGQ